MGPKHEEDSDSAPEDIAFKDAKSDALAHLKTVSEAAKHKKKLRKDQIKKRQDALAEQKQIKKQKMDELESKKLPTDVLNDLEDGTEENTEDDKILKIPKVDYVQSSSGNSRIVFDEQEDGDVEDNDNDEFIALSTENTDFKVVTSTDLKSSSFKSKDAYSFRERMLYGDRVRREPHKNQRLRQEKLKVTGLSQKLTSSS